MSIKITLSNLANDPTPTLIGMSPWVKKTVSRFQMKAQDRLCIGFTLNGNRTWAKQAGLNADPVAGHRKWVDAVLRTMVDVRKNYGHIFGSAFMWGLSDKNLNSQKWRSAEEVTWLLNLLKEFATGRWLEMAHKHCIHVFMLGDEDMLSERDPEVVEKMKRLSDQTKQYDRDFRLAIWLAYWMEHEISRHMDMLIRWWESGDTETLRRKAFEISHKWLKHPDIAIRTWTDGNRTSWGFIWDNTELVFFKTYWPLFWPLLLRYAAYRRIKAKINDGK